MPLMLIDKTACDMKVKPVLIIVIPQNLVISWENLLIMNYLDYVTLRGDISWDMHSNLCFSFLRSTIAEWIGKLREHSWRHNLELRLNDIIICWTCQDNIRISFFCKECDKHWCRSCYGRYLEHVKYLQCRYPQVLNKNSVDEENFISY